MPQLLSNASATGAEAQWGGGLGVFSAAGTFGGATITLQFLGPDESTWIDVGAETTFTAPGGAVFVLPPTKIRAEVSGGPPSGMYAQAELAK